MSSSTQYKDLGEFLAKHTTKATTTGGTTQPTHTRIGDKELNIYGGAYIIPKEDLATFHQLYSQHIFTNGRKEYLTEKQLENGAGPMVVDFDFRYNYSVEKRIHTKEHIQDMVLLYLEELKVYFTFTSGKPFDIFVFEKPAVNRLSDGSLTKDGIHMLIGIQVDHTVQQMTRDKMLVKLPEVWADLPLINDWASVLDEGISKGKTNWQLFGSRKPGNDAYELTQHYNISYDNADGEFMMDELDASKFDMKRNFARLSVQYDANPKFEMNPKIVDAYNKRAQNKDARIKKPVSKTKVNLLVEDDADEPENEMSPSDIIDEATLDKAINIMISNLKPNEYEVKGTHMYTQTLPAKYYEPGSHLLNRMVAFALKHTDERLFLSWIKLRSKATDFDYGDIPKLYNDWKVYFKNNKDTSVTRRSIMYWSKQDAFEEYEKVKAETIDAFIDESLFSQAEFDLAHVLKQMFKDKYVCVSLTGMKGGVWYVFKNHRWEPDKGLSLRLAISKDMYTLFSNKSEVLTNEFHHYDDTDDRAEHIKKKVGKIQDIMIKLKRTNDKNNIMREAMELFYDNEFIKNMDNNRYLLCFNNGVVDFKKKVFRDGYPQDYITKTTGINYTAYTDDSKKTGEEILDFMEKLFPIADLNRYMWDHLASCLIGTNKNQTFNVYHGSGSNGKSILADLMSVTLGDYKGTVPITLVTEKRGSIGGTGGDPLQARALYCESETFDPQFKLVVCTNNLFDIQSNDDGTWRRIRKCDFVAKFVDDDEAHTDETPYVFPKDKTLKEKLPLFAPVFASMLVMRAFQTDGVVKDCDYVMAASNKYRNGQDHIAAFVSELVIKTGVPTDKIKKTALSNAFKFWFQQEQGNAKMPKGQELHAYMDKKYGACGQSGWSGVKMKEPDNEDEVAELEHS